MIHLLSIVCLLISAQEIQTNQDLPQSLQSLNQQDTETTNLLEALLNGKTRKVDNLANRVYAQISGKDKKLQQDDFVTFINETQFNIRYSENGTQVMSTPMPDTQLIDQAAQLQFQAINSTDGVISKQQFEGYVGNLLKINYTFLPAVCLQVELQNSKCKTLASQNEDLKSVYKAVGRRMDVVADSCKKGLTALGGYSKESCQWGAAQRVSEHADEDTQVRNCMEQMQCYFLPDEERINPLNVEVPQDAVLTLSASPSPQSLAASSFLSVILEQAFKLIFKKVVEIDSVILAGSVVLAFGFLYLGAAGLFADLELAGYAKKALMIFASILGTTVFGGSGAESIMNLASHKKTLDTQLKVVQAGEIVQQK